MKMWFYISLIFALLSLGAAKPSKTSIRSPVGPSSFIIGGQDAAPGQFPSQLSIEYSGSLGWQHQCGGVLYKTKYVLTAAHCIVDYPISDLRVWAGVIHRDNTAATNGQMIPVLSMLAHPGYDPNLPGIPNDIAIITLINNANISLESIANAILPPDDTNEFNHASCFVSGFGRTQDDQPDMANTLQWKQITTISNTDCADRFGGLTHANIFDTHLCVMTDPPQDGPCNGDGGGPVYCHASETDQTTLYLAGVTSWNAAVNGNCNLNYPTVANRISKYLQWIEDNTK